MFEHRSQPLISQRKFLIRALRYAFFSSSIIGVSLWIGMAGYHHFAGGSWMDAFYNASMILTGMGPGLDIETLAPERRESTELFAGAYAIYSGVVFLAASGLMLSPILHRFFHNLHLDIKA